MGGWDVVGTNPHTQAPTHTRSPPTPIQGLSSLVSTTALALLRSSNDWVSGYGESRQFGTGTGDSGKAEAEYSRLAVRERSKVSQLVSQEARGGHGRWMDGWQAGARSVGRAGG